jgi:RND family efflux transporter MFP subunit
MFLAAGMLAAVTSCGGKKSGQQVPVGEVVRGTFYVDMYEEGEIEAVNSINISAPTLSWRYNNLKITGIIKDGQEVQAGDTVVRFDPQDVQRGIIDAEARMEVSRAELEKLLAQQKSDLAGLRADHEVSRIAHEISKIRFEQAEYESEISRRQIQLNLEQAEIALERAAEQIDNQIKIQKEDVRQMELSIQQDQARLTEAYETLDKLSIVSPAPGIGIIARNWSTQNKYQVGDQVWTGTALIQLPDLSALKAVVQINEVDIAKIVAGQQVEIKPDAFSDTRFTGSVTTIANLAVNKDNSTKIKVFPVEIRINETHKNLLPGLTVNCRIIVDKLEDVLYVPLTAVFSDSEGQYVYRRTAAGFDRVAVTTGPSNADYIVVSEGLDEKDAVALTDPYYDPEAEEGQGGEDAKEQPNTPES